MAAQRVDVRLLARLLAALGEEDPEAVLRGALDVVVDAVGAARGYLAVGADAAAPRWVAARGLGDERVAEVSEAVSRGVLRAALAADEVVRSAAAMSDPRFASRESVKLRGIEAVVAARIGTPALGVLYLEGAGEAVVRFDEEAVALVGELAARLEPVARRLVARPDGATDPTAPWRAGGRFQGIVGRSAALAAALRDASRFAASDLPILLTGPTGAGKSALAQEIHAASARARRPFVAVNCAAIPAELFESEMFGAAAGAHSTARTARAGLVAEAEGGTLFLDEVGELPPAAQAKLLLLLADGVYTRLGDARARRADVRVIAATNQDLDAAVRAGRFRADLRFRLDVLRLAVPGLAERADDLPLLVEAVGARVAEEAGLPWPGLAVGGMAAVLAHDWPGQVRELQNALARALVRSGGDGPLTAAQLDLPGTAPTGAVEDGPWQPLTDAVAAFRDRRVAAALDAAGGNMSRAARLLGISRSYLYELVGRS